MATITVRARYDHAPEVVWEELRHIDRHVLWMNDALSITFVGEQTEGVGTTFRCLTKVGPIRVNDVMTITAWQEPRAMGVAHSGIVKGDGTFTLTSDGAGTLLTWQESLTMPWFLLGPVGAAVAVPILRHIWRINLANLGRRLEELSAER